MNQCVRARHRSGPAAGLHATRKQFTPKTHRLPEPLNETLKSKSDESSADVLSTITCKHSAHKLSNSTMAEAEAHKATAGGLPSPCDEEESAIVIINGTTYSQGLHGLAWTDMAQGIDAAGTECGTGWAGVLYVYAN